MNQSSQIFGMPEIILLLVLLAAIGAVVWFTLRDRKKQARRDSYTEALEHLVSGNVSLAIQKLKDAVREDSENIRAYLILGNVLRDKGLAQHALKIHRDLTLRETLSPELKQEVYLALVRDYEVLGKWDQAIEAARKYLQLARTPRLSLLKQLLELYEKKQDWQAAYGLAQKYAKLLGPEMQRRMALYLVFQGVQLMEQGEGKEARIKFKEALKRDPQCVAAYYYLGKSYLQEQRLNDAEQTWKKLCMQVPDKAYLVFPELERVWFDLGRYTEAEQLYMQLLTQNNGSKHAALALARIYNKKGEYDAALEVLEKARNGVPREELMGLMLQILWNKNQYKQAATQAIQYFEKLDRSTKTSFQCRICGATYSEPQWRCTRCGAVDSIVL